ncbi:MAG: DUF1761 domain-containing protein [Anaerolineae bacterium]
MITFNVSWLAIIIATVVNMAIGAGWYGYFAEPWMAGNGFTKEQIEANPSNTPYIVAGANSLVMSFVLANVINWTGATGLLNGLLTGLLMWVGFTALTMGANHAFESRSFTMWGINSGMYMVSLTVIGAIIGAFG